MEYEQIEALELQIFFLLKIKIKKDTSNKKIAFTMWNFLYFIYFCFGLRFF